MKPICLNRFVKKLTRNRVVPTISAMVSWLIFGITVGPPLLAKLSKQQQSPSESLFAGIEKLVNQVRFVSDVPPTNTL
jgi:hypothetical protein